MVASTVSVSYSDSNYAQPWRKTMGRRPSPTVLATEAQGLWFGSSTHLKTKHERIHLCPQCWKVGDRPLPGHPGSLDQWAPGGVGESVKTNKQIIDKVESGRGKELDVIVNLWPPHASALMSMITRMLMYTHKQTHVYSWHTWTAKHDRIS